jgi:hypothetical protein
MKLEISGFSHVAIRVTDLQRARRFYVDLLGLPVALEVEGVVLVKTGAASWGSAGMPPERSRVTASIRIAWAWTTCRSQSTRSSHSSG